MCLVPLYCTQYLCVPLFATFTTVTITITAYSILFSHNYSLFCLQGRFSNTTVLFTRNFTQGWLNSNWLSSALFRSVWRTFLKQKDLVLAFSRTPSLSLVYVHSVPFSLILVVSSCVFCTYCLLLRLLSLRSGYLSLSHSWSLFL